MGINRPQGRWRGGRKQTVVEDAKILAALKDKPLKLHTIMMRVNPSWSMDALQDRLMKMRDEGKVKFDIRTGLWSLVTG
jgi:hypothetical protein